MRKEVMRKVVSFVENESYYAAIRLPENFATHTQENLRGIIFCELSVASCQLRVVSCELRVVSCELVFTLILRVASCELRVGFP